MVDKINVNVNENVDFVLMFYMVHEVPNKENLFKEILPLINKNGLLMIVEPKFVSKNNFNKIMDKIKENGFEEYNQKPRSKLLGMVYFDSYALTK
jgi:ubiquinone/menaquinone biosynthesis C-methylase UbiE